MFFGKNVNITIFKLETSKERLEAEEIKYNSKTKHKPKLIYIGIIIINRNHH